jgi:hypothetical protein
MELVNVCRTVGKTRGLAAVIGAAAVVTMGALTIGHTTDEVGPSVASSDGGQVVTVTKTTAPKELPTPFAKPTYVATPCAKRATMPC